MSTGPMSHPGNNSPRGETLPHAPDLAEFAAAMARLQAHHPGVLLHMEPIQAWAVMAALHLALRHPQLSEGPTREMIRRAARDIRESIAPDGILAAVAEAGRRGE